MHYMGGCNVITKVLIKWAQEGESKRKCVDRSRDWNNVRPRAKECRQTLGAEKG